ncbi:MAG: undecaprenyldiphospho-muramoylpentapeptide beta-N-acetylglucosaminyltransferase [Deltaproteobacteria bacterium]|jgi:UDP-N-acetylglucosamine--N-acetylmuramyl-(pentapeptide) pyrophosphoryl-undecaprenol N-acetylglucosamine transferase
MKVLIAGGGTGGHLFPGIAVAEAFRIRERAADILFVGTSNPMEVSTLANKGFRHAAIVSEGLKGRGVWRQVRSLLKIPIGVWQTLRIIWRFNPDIIIGLGGYASGPVALAAKLTGKRLVIHEQNILPGLTNRILGRFADRIFVSFPDKLGRFQPSKTMITGNPVRRELLSRKPAPKTSGRFTVLILGGSQGAHALNCAMVDALDHLKNRPQMAFIHQTGAKDAAWVSQAYKSRGIEAVVEPFFEDMAGPYGASDFVVCRAGATTVSELMAMGKPAILVPFPFAANSHQELNARHLVDVGGAELILERDLDGVRLAERIDYYALHPETLEKMQRETLALALPDAAEAIVNACRRLVLVGH